MNNIKHKLDVAELGIMNTSRHIKARCMLVYEVKLANDFSKFFTTRDEAERFVSIQTSKPGAFWGPEHYRIIERDVFSRAEDAEC